MIRALLVDDDDAARRYLRALLTEAHTDVHVIGEAANITEAQAAIALLKPDLVLLDVEMPGGSGFDLLLQLKRWDFTVVFTTSHQHYAIQAIRFSALDYLPKPVLPEELTAAMGRLREQRDVATPSSQVQDQFIANIAQRDVQAFRLTIPHGDRTFFVAPAEVVRCEAERNYTWVHLGPDRRYLLARTLKEFEEMLEPFGFVRLNRGDLVRRQVIVHLEGGYAVLRDGHRIEVSRRRLAELKQFLAS
ncbi:MAG: response regulator [Flavobacteriales bacterium]|nr:response regulator [Flavobacteriales bacterium]